jgi:hypothetical protein
MDLKEREGERRIKKIKATLASLEADNTKPLAEKERLRLLWEGELTYQEDRLYQYRLQKETNV